MRYALPHADAANKSEEEVGRKLERGGPLEFSHPPEDQIGGQIDAGFAIAGLYEDRRRDDRIVDHMPTYIATRAIK